MNGEEIFGDGVLKSFLMVLVSYDRLLVHIWQDQMTFMSAHPRFAVSTYVLVTPLQVQFVHQKR